MATKKSGRAGGFPPARLNPETPATSADPPTTSAELTSAELPETSADPHARVESLVENISREETKVMPSYGTRTQTQTEGVTVIGEAVRRIPSESAEVIIEVTSAAPTAAQALRDNHTKTMQITQAIAPLGVQQADVQAISVKLQNVYSPVMPSLPGYAGMPQIGQGGFSPYAAGAAPMQPEVQFGSYFASNTLRVNVREAGRAGDIADTAARAGATVIGGVRFRPADEATARRSALEAAAKDARLKAETLAAATGKQVGDPIAITEDLVASNGTYVTLRAMAPFAFGAGAPEAVGELEYYARVSANFRLV